MEVSDLKPHKLKRGKLTDDRQVDFQIARRRVAEIHTATVHTGIGHFDLLHLQLCRMGGGTEERPQAEHFGRWPKFRLEELAAAHVKAKGEQEKW